MESDLDRRECVLPECHSLPRTKFTTGKFANPVYTNVNGFDHAHGLSEIMRLAATFARPEVWQDWQLLARIFYRNWNQHRNSLYYRRLYELRRVLRIMDQQGVREMLGQLIGAFFTAGTAKSARKVVAWSHLPCAYFIARVAGRIARLAQLAGKIRCVCWNVYVQFAAQTAQTLFMPLSMVVQGISARLYMVMQTWVQDLLALYELLFRWLPYLPACPETLSGKRVDMLMPPDEIQIPVPMETPGVVEKLVADAQNLSLKQMADKREMSEEETPDASRNSTSKQTKKKKRKHFVDMYNDEDIGDPV